MEGIQRLPTPGGWQEKLHRRTCCIVEVEESGVGGRERLWLTLVEDPEKISMLQRTEEQLPSTHWSVKEEL